MSWNKYGKTSFSFSILEVCGEPDLLKREVYWITELKSIDVCYGYNSCLPTDTRYIQIRKRKVTAKNPKIRGISCKPIVCVNKTTGEIFIKNSFLIETELGITKKLGDCLNYWNGICRNVQKYNKGWMFIRESEYIPGFDYINYQRPRVPYDFSKRKPRGPNKKPKKIKIKRTPIPYCDRKFRRSSVIATQVSTGTEITYPSISECIRKLGLRHQAIEDILGKKPTIKTHRGYSFRRV